MQLNFKIQAFTMKKILLTFAILFISGNCFQALATGMDNNNKSESSQQNIKNNKIEIKNAWARKSMSPNTNSAAYMSINNLGDQQITIIGASAVMAANNVELHKSFVDEKGISRMTSIDKIVVPAKSTVELTPGAIHIMLFDLKKNLVAGDKFNITLKIENMDPITVETIVKE